MWGGAYFWLYIKCGVLIFEGCLFSGKYSKTSYFWIIQIMLGISKIFCLFRTTLKNKIRLVICFLNAPVAPRPLITLRWRMWAQHGTCKISISRIAFTTLAPLSVVATNNFCLSWNCSIIWFIAFWIFSPICFSLIFSQVSKASLSDQSIGSNHPAVTPIYGSSLCDDHKSVVIQIDWALYNMLLSCSID